MTEILRSPDTDKIFPSEEDEPNLHVEESPLNSKGTCWKHGCTVCTRLDECIQSNDDYKGISKRRRKKNSNNDGIVSDDEKKLLGQFRSQTKPDNEGVDIGPI